MELPVFLRSPIAWLPLVAAIGLTGLFACRPTEEPEPYTPKVDEPFDEDAWDSPTQPAAVTLQEILDGSHDVLWVSHDVGPGGWQFLDGQDVKYREPVAVEKWKILELDEGLKAVTDLPVGWFAERADKHSTWTRAESPQAESTPTNK